jgi:hypothetical protein
MDNKTFDLIWNKTTTLNTLRGVIMGILMWDDNVSNKVWGVFYKALVDNYEMEGEKMSGFDVERLKKRAKEIGATI